MRPVFQGYACLSSGLIRVEYTAGSRSDKKSDKEPYTIEVSGSFFEDGGNQMRWSHHQIALEQHAAIIAAIINTGKTEAMPG